MCRGRGEQRGCAISFLQLSKPWVFEVYYGILNNLISVPKITYMP